MPRTRKILGLALLAATAMLVSQAQAQPQDPTQTDVRPLVFPVHSNNVLFVSPDGHIVYGVAGLHVTEFLSVPVVGGTLWEKRTNSFYAFAAVQTANRRKWVWLTNGGPAGVVIVGDKVRWADNREHRGCVVPL